MAGIKRENIKPGCKVSVVQKQDQRSGKLTQCQRDGSADNIIPKK